MEKTSCMAALTYGEVVADLPLVERAARDRMLALPPTTETHRTLLAATPALQFVEAGGTATAAKSWPLCIACWNAQRFHRFDAGCALIRSVAADVVLLSELDIGMARTGQRHCLRDAAAALGGCYVFGAEFLELGLGDDEEQRRCAGLANEIGLHGNGILSNLALATPVLIRLETDGDWFDGDRGERRVGGRCAVAASIAVGGEKALFVSVHLESHSDPAQRAEQMRRLFDAVDAIAPTGPVVIGGDLNTSTLAHGDPFDLAAALRDDPNRLVRPERYEPLFDLARARGYAWSDANAAGPTERPAEAAPPPLAHIDWFLIRGLRASAPAIVPAVDPQGTIISDHEMIVVTLAA